MAKYYKSYTMTEPKSPNTKATAASRPDASRSIARLLTITAGLVFVILIWGAVVRLTGSGLSIPDWPLINGSLLPPSSEAGWAAVQEDYRLEALRIGKTAFPADISVETFRKQFWIEWTHRAIAGVVGIVFLIAFIKMMRSPAVRAKSESNFYLLGGLLIAQAGLGGVVVMGALSGLMVSLHLIAAYVFFAALVWTALRLMDTEQAPAGGSRSAGLIPLRAIWVTTGLVLLQVFLGGLVAGDAKANLVTSWPMMFGGIIPPGELLWSSQFGGIGNLIMNPILVQFMHRWMPLILIVAFGYLRMVTARVPLKKHTKVMFRAADALFLFQIMVGIMNVMFGAMMHVSALHSAIALCLFGSLVVILHDLRYSSGELALGKSQKKAAITK